MENNNNNKPSFQNSNISYIHGASEIPLLHDTVGDRLRLAVENVPNRIMVIFPEEGIRKTYQQVFNDARQFAASLLRLNLKKGDRIGIWSPNCYEWIIAKFAAAFSGLIIVCINPEYKNHELKYVLQKVGVSAIISPAKDQTNNYYRILCELIPEISSSKNGNGKIESKNFPNLKNIILLKTNEKLCGAWNFNELLKLRKTDDDFKLLDERESQIRVDDPFNILFTSGTTGRPKAATLTHHNVINNTYFLGLRAGLREAQEILCCPLVLFSSGAFLFGSLCSLCHFETIIYPAKNATSVLKVINDERATALYGVPTMLIEMLNHPDLPYTNISSLRAGLFGGTSTPDEVFKKVVKTLGLQRYINTYGATETVMTTSSFADDESLVKSMFVMPHMEIGIINNHGEFVSRGKKGELVVRGYSIYQGYWNDEEKTAEVFGKDRWYHTGDIGSMNHDGSIEICGRYKDIVIRGGFNFYPTEIEQFIVQHPSIADAYVIGVPDKIHGEELCAWIQLKPNTTLTIEELIKFLSKRISKSKIPRYLLFKLRHEFPFTPSGKLKKYELQKLSIKELNLENVTSYCAA